MAAHFLLLLKLFTPLVDFSLHPDQLLVQDECASYPWRIKAAGGLLEASALYKTETCRSISEPGQKREREEAGALETR